MLYPLLSAVMILMLVNVVVATPYVYISNYGNPGTVSVINTDTNNVTATTIVVDYPFGVAVMPDGTKVYVTNYNSNNVSLINSWHSCVHLWEVGDY
jgi:YVTN family beta-propeller protein